MSDRNAFGGIVEPFRFEPCVSDSEEEGGNVREDVNAGRMFTTDWMVLIFC